MKKTADILSYDEIEVGSVYSFSRVISQSDVLQFAGLCGDHNPLHISEDYARNSEFGKNVVHGMLTASLFSALVGMYCPGEKSLYLGQSLQFKMPLFYGETVLVKGTVLNKVDALKMLKIKTEIFRCSDLILCGEAQVKMLE